MSRAVAIVVLHESAMATARRIREHLPDARIHGRADGVDVVFESLGDHVRALFRAGAPIVGLCAAGVLIRVLAPVLGDKRREPPVVAVADDGSAVVPLLGGHRGGNALARDIAAALGVTASRWFYAGLLAAAYSTIAILAATQSSSAWVALGLLPAPWAVDAVRKLFQADDRMAMNRIMVRSAKLHGWTGVTMATGLAIAAI